MSNAAIYLATGVTWSISTTALQAGIKLQLNTMLYTKTLMKKDIASAGDDAHNVGGVSEEAAKDKKKKESTESTKEQDGEDEGVSSKTQIMVGSQGFEIAILSNESCRRSLQSMWIV